MARWIDRLCDAAAVAGIVCLIGAIAIVMIDIVLRRIFDLTVIGTVDLTQLCVMAAAFWSIPYGFLRDAHVRVELLTDRLPTRWQALLDAIAALVGCALIALLLGLSWGQALLRVEYGDRSLDLGIPMILYWGFLLSGCALACLATLTVAARRLRTALGG